MKLSKNNGKKTKNPFPLGLFLLIKHLLPLPKKLWLEVKISNSVCFALDRFQTGSREWNAGALALIDVTSPDTNE